MNILKKAKKTYDSIEIPQELDYTVNKAIHKKDLYKKNYVVILTKRATATLATTFALFVVLLNTNESFARAMGDVPIIGSLAEVFTVREYREENDTDLIEAKIPAIKNTGNEDLEDRINYEISSKINEVLEEARARAEEYKEAVLSTGGTMDDYIPTKINVDYKITYQDDKIISFVITKSESSASAYQEQYFYNIDIQNGKELNLRDVLGEDYKKIVDEEVNKQIRERMEKNEENIYFTAEEGGFSGIENKYQDFYIDENKKATVVFQKYEIAPGYMGIQNFEISNDVLEKEEENNGI